TSGTSGQPRVVSSRRKHPEHLEGSLLSRQQLLECQTNLGTARSEGRANLTVREVLLGEVIYLRRQFDVSNFASQSGRTEVRVDEPLHLGTVRGFARDVDEQGTLALVGPDTRNRDINGPYPTGISHWFLRC